ncbi:MAG: ATP-binding protein, partial [Ktedonobacterales bacterium]
VRLLTLTGPGGCGKTALALHLLAEARDEYRDGAVFVPLAPLRTAEHVEFAIAHALGTSEARSQPVHDRLAAILAEKHLLLVLDNFEHVAKAAPAVAHLITSCPDLTILITSRAPLHIPGEHDFPIAPLPVPPKQYATDILAIRDFAAVALFVERARAADPTFHLTPANCSAVAGVCRRLGGLPLAIELAARRMRLLSPETLLEHLAEFQEPRGDPTPNCPDHHQTLWDTLAWSYELLSPSEQRLFRGLSVFAGGFTLEAALALHEALAIAGDDVIRDLTSLVDKNLVLAASTSRDERRFDMLEPLREFSVRVGRAHTDVEQARRVHASYCIQLAEKADAHGTGPDQVVWLERLDEERNNLRTSLGFLLAENDVNGALRLAGSLWRFWLARGYLTEGRQWLGRALDALPPDSALSPTSTAVLAKALIGAGILAAAQADVDCAEKRYEQALQLCRDAGNRSGTAHVLNCLAEIYRERDDHARAQAHYEESLRIRTALGDVAGIGSTANNLGLLRMQTGDYPGADRLFQLALTNAQAVEHTRLVAVVLANLGELARLQCRYQQAATLLTESLSLRRAASDLRGAAQALGNLGAIAHASGDDSKALALFRECLESYAAIGARAGIVQSLHAIAATWVTLGQAARAARLFGAASRLAEAIGAASDSTSYPELEEAIVTMRETLGEECSAAEWTIGRSYTQKRAIEEALGQPST